MELLQTKRKDLHLTVEFSCILFNLLQLKDWSSSDVVLPHVH